MARLLLLVGVVVIAIAGVTGEARALTVCFGLSNFDNKFRFEVFQAGPTFVVTGSERLFEERPVTGVAYLEPDGQAARVGFTLFGTQKTGFFNAQIFLATLTGPYFEVDSALGARTGIMTAIPCENISLGAAARGGTLRDALAD